jgi:short-subunit dehydrogenase
VNTLSHYFLAKEFIPHMASTDHGIVVTIASLAAYVTAPNMVDYAASKAAALVFHEGLAAELVTRYHAPKVRTVVVTPGYTRTPLFQGFLASNSFMTPALHPQTVAEAVVKKILAGESGHVVLPGSANLVVTNFRGLPYWFQVNARKKSEKMMKRWEGRQVIDPEKRYAEETQ